MSFTAVLTPQRETTVCFWYGKDQKRHSHYSYKRRKAFVARTVFRSHYISIFQNCHDFGIAEPPLLIAKLFSSSFENVGSSDISKTLDLLNQVYRGPGYSLVPKRQKRVQNVYKKNPIFLSECGRGPYHSAVNFNTLFRYFNTRLYFCGQKPFNRCRFWNFVYLDLWIQI